MATNKFDLFNFPPESSMTLRFVPDYRPPIHHWMKSDSPTSVENECPLPDMPRRTMVSAVKLVAQKIAVPQHKKRSWMRESYHQRIQKKWDRRHGGIKMVPGEHIMFSLPDKVLNKLIGLRK